MFFTHKPPPKNPILLIDETRGTSIQIWPRVSWHKMEDLNGAMLVVTPKHTPNPGYVGSIWVFPKMVGFPPKSSLFNTDFHINHPFWGYPKIFGNIHIYLHEWLIWNCKCKVNIPFVPWIRNGHGSVQSKGHEKTSFWRKTIIITSRELESSKNWRLLSC